MGRSVLQNRADLAHALAENMENMEIYAVSNGRRLGLISSCGITLCGFFQSISATHMLDCWVSRPRVSVHHADCPLHHGSPKVTSSLPPTRPCWDHIGSHGMVMQMLCIHIPATATGSAWDTLPRD
jgi:hypothetical protein